MFNSLFTSSFAENFSELLITLLAVLIALTLHEFAHGYTAYKLGDNTARYMGRLSLNPMRHLDPLGTICMIFFHFGWAKPVPIDPRYFRKPKRDFAITALMGPLTNIVVGFITGFFYVLFYSIFYKYGVSSDIPFVYNSLYYLFEFFGVFFSVNIGLGIFNLIPIPPFDGSRLLNVILPERLYFKVMRYERQIYLALVGWLLLGPWVYRAIVSLPFVASNPVLSSIAKIFSLSGLISEATGFIINRIIDLWLLLPIF